MDTTRSFPESRANAITAARTLAEYRFADLFDLVVIKNIAFGEAIMDMMPFSVHEAEKHYGMKDGFLVNESKKVFSRIMKIDDINFSALHKKYMQHFKNKNLFSWKIGDYYFFNIHGDIRDKRKHSDEYTEASNRQAIEAYERRASKHDINSAKGHDRRQGPKSDRRQGDRREEQKYGTGEYTEKRRGDRRQMTRRFSDRRDSILINDKVASKSSRETVDEYCWIAQMLTEILYNNFELVFRKVIIDREPILETLEEFYGKVVRSDFRSTLETRMKNILLAKAGYKNVAKVSLDDARTAYATEESKSICRYPELDAIIASITEIPVDVEELAKRNNIDVSLGGEDFQFSFQKRYAQAYRLGCALYKIPLPEILPSCRADMHAENEIADFAADLVIPPPVLDEIMKKHPLIISNLAALFDVNRGDMAWQLTRVKKRMEKRS